MVDSFAVKLDKKHMRACSIKFICHKLDWGKEISVIMRLVLCHKMGPVFQ